MKDNFDALLEFRGHKAQLALKALKDLKEILGVRGNPDSEDLEEIQVILEQQGRRDRAETIESTLRLIEDSCDNLKDPSTTNYIQHRLLTESYK